MDISEMQEMVKQFCEERDWSQFHNPKDLAIGISTEANELLDIFRFKSDEQIRAMLAVPEKKEAIADEVADTLYFILRFAQMNNIDLSDALVRKIKKNEEKYPIYKATGKNLKYKEL